MDDLSRARFERLERAADELAARIGVVEELVEDLEDRVWARFEETGLVTKADWQLEANAPFDADSAYKVMRRRKARGDLPERLARVEAAIKRMQD